jgi:hypothetical protein
VLLSGDARVLKKTWQVRAYTYLRKPLDVDELLIAVWTALAVP